MSSKVRFARLPARGYWQLALLSILSLCGFSLEMGNGSKFHPRGDFFLEITEQGSSEGVIASFEPIAIDSFPVKNGTRLIVYSDSRGNVHRGTLPLDGAKSQTLHLPISINEGDLFDLQQISGVGKHLSRLVLQEREKRGEFDSWEALREVPGIGPKKLESLKREATLEKGWKGQVKS